MNLRAVLAAIVFMHLYLGVRLLPDLWRAWPAAAAALGLLLLASMVLAPQPMLAFIGGRQAGHALQWAGFLALGWFSWLLVFTLLRDVALLFGWLAVAGGWHAPAWPWRAGSAAVVVALTFAASALAVYNARRTAPIKRVDVALAGLPPALEGFRIAQLTDLHVGPTIRRDYLARVVARANSAGADAIVITGDLVDGQVPALAADVAPLAELKAPLGVFVVTGNHEYYSGAARWVAEFRRLGLTVLDNRHVLLRRTPGAADADALLLAGVNDFTAGHFDPAWASDPARAMAGAPRAVGARVLLAHQPRSAPAAAAAGFQLQLSGHTHGGQFWPWVYFVPLQNPVVAGLDRIDGMQIYVSRGTGYWGPPMRLGAPSEITLITLHAAPR